MNAPLRRGLCPTLAEPMQTGDGLLVRLNPVASGLSPKTLIGLCKPHSATAMASSKSLRAAICRSGG